MMYSNLHIQGPHLTHFTGVVLQAREVKHWCLGTLPGLCLQHEIENTLQPSFVVGLSRKLTYGPVNLAQGACQSNALSKLASWSFQYTSGLAEEY